MSPNWYALFVQHNKERSVAAHLDAMGVVRMLPLYSVRRRWSDRIQKVSVPLFPGYAFCKVSLDGTGPRILGIPGVMRFVGFGRRPAPIPENEVDIIQQLDNNSRSYRPWSFLVPGKVVRVEQGPFRGLSGKIIQVRKYSYLVVSLDFLQRSVAVELSYEDVLPLQAASTAA